MKRSLRQTVNLEDLRDRLEPYGLTVANDLIQSKRTPSTGPTGVDIGGLGAASIRGMSKTQIDRDLEETLKDSDINSLPSNFRMNAMATGTGTRLKDIPRSNLPKALKDFLNAMEAVKGEDYGNYKMKKGPTGSWIFDTQNMPEAQLSNLKAAAFNAAKKTGITKIEASAPAATTVASAFAPTPSTSIPTPTARPSIREVLTAPAMPAPSPLSTPSPAPDRFAGNPNDYMGTPTNDRFDLGTPPADPGGVAERLRGIATASVPASPSSRMMSGTPVAVQGATFTNPGDAIKGTRDVGPAYGMQPPGKTPLSNLDRYDYPDRHNLNYFGMTPTAGPTPAPARPASVPASDPISRDPFSFTPSPEVHVNSPISPAGAYAEATAPASVPAAVEQQTMSPNPFSMAPTTAATSLQPPGTGPMDFFDMATGTITPANRDINAMTYNFGPTFDPNNPPAAVDPNAPPAAQTNLAPTQPPPATVVQPLPEPVPIQPKPVAEVADAAPVMASPVPSLTPRDIYSGTVGTAVDNTGNNYVSRDNFGTTSVTNQFGATTAMTPGGYQSAYGGAAPAWGGDAAFGGGATSDFGQGVGRIGSSVGDSVKGSLRSLSKSLGIGGGLPGIAKAMIGLDPSKSFASQRNEFMGKLVGTVGGGALAGMPGALGGGWLGGELGAQHDFPDKPSGGSKSGVSGGDRTRSERASRSPAASRALDRSDRTTGLW